MKTMQLFSGGSLTFSSNGNYGGTYAYYRSQNAAPVVKRDWQGDKQLSFEELLQQELGIKPVTQAGWSNIETQSGDSDNSVMDALATHRLWEFWA